MRRTRSGEPLDAEPGLLLRWAVLRSLLEEAELSSPGLAGLRGADLDRAALEAELKAALAEKLAAFKIPSVWRFTEAELPRTGTGKVLKRELRSVFGAQPTETS